MELIGRILDGSIPQDLKDALRRAQPSGFRVSPTRRCAHLEEVPCSPTARRSSCARCPISRVWSGARGHVVTRRASGDEFFVISTGRRRWRSGKEARVLRPGTLRRDEPARRGPALVTVRGRRPCRVLVIDRKNFQGVLREFPTSHKSFSSPSPGAVRALETPEHLRRLAGYFTERRGGGALRDHAESHSRCTTLAPHEMLGAASTTRRRYGSRESAPLPPLLHAVHLESRRATLSRICLKLLPRGEPVGLGVFLQTPIFCV